MATIPLTISGIKEAKQQLSELGDEFEKFKKDPIKSKKLADEFNSLSKSIDKAEESFNDLNKSGKNLSATFEQIYGEDLQPMSSRIGELEDRLYELANAGQQNTKEFQDMAAEAARLRRNIIETDKQVDLLAENKGFAVFGTGIGQVGESLLRLDFDTAAKDAEAMNLAVGNLGQMGSQAITGFTSTFKNLGKAFASMGKALLANPIFLIAAVIIAVVAAVVKLMDELGILQPILDGIGKVFEWIMTPIRALIDGLKALTDWFGWTSHAAAESAEKQAKAAEKAAEAQKKAGEETIQNLENQIRMAELNGEETANLERQKVNEIRKTAEEQKKADRLAYEAAKIKGDLSEEELADLKETARQSRLTYEQAVADVKYFEAEKKKELRDAREEEKRLAKERKEEEERLRQEQLEKDREAYKQRLEEKKKFEEDRLKIARQIQDLELSLSDDGITKEIEANKLRYERLIEDLQANESLLQEEKERLTALYAEQQFEKEKEIELKYQKELWDALDAAEQERKEKKRLEREEELAEQEAFNNALLMASGVYFKKAEEQEMTYAEAKEKLQETMFSSFSSLANSLEQAGIKSAALQKTLALVEIASNTAKALSSVIAGATAASTAAGPAAPFVLAGYIASGIATVASGIASAYAALKSAPSIGGGGTGGGGGAIGGVATAAVSATPAQPSFDLFGQNNDLNNLSNQGDVETSQAIQVKAVVSETEVTDTQNKIKKIKDSATL